jgi:hypothetical protein
MEDHQSNGYPKETTPGIAHKDFRNREVPDNKAGRGTDKGEHQRINTPGASVYWFTTINTALHAANVIASALAKPLIPSMKLYKFSIQTR